MLCLNIYRKTKKKNSRWKFITPKRLFSRTLILSVSQHDCLSKKRLLRRLGKFYKSTVVLPKLGRQQKHKINHYYQQKKLKKTDFYAFIFFEHSRHQLKNRSLQAQQCPISYDSNQFWDQIKTLKEFQQIFLHLVTFAQTFGIENFSTTFSFVLGWFLRYRVWSALRFPTECERLATRKHTTFSIEQMANEYCIHYTVHE